MRHVLFLVLVLLAGIPVQAAENTAAENIVAETVLAEPRPGWDNPRKLVLQLTVDDPGQVNNVLYNAVNVQKFYGQTTSRWRWWPLAPRALLQGQPRWRDRVASLRQYEVEARRPRQHLVHRQEAVRPVARVAWPPSASPRSWNGN